MFRRREERVSSTDAACLIGGRIEGRSSLRWGGNADSDDSEEYDPD
ncbi:MAG: hypothetical protein II746_05160 [Bacteroidaceae bacterium]|nr:hypothetical protein [Bacteroidaceae bacterium]